MMSYFSPTDIGIALLLLMALLLLAAAFLKSGPSVTTREARRDTETALFHEAIAELAAREQAGEITAEVRASLQAEMEHQWLDDIELSAVKDQAQPLTVVKSPQRFAVWCIAATLVIVVALASYAWLGARNMERVTQLLAERGSLTADEQIVAVNTQLLVLLETELARHPHSLQALYLRGNVRLDSGDVAGAITDYQAYVTQEPNDVRVLAELAQALYLGSNRQLTPEIQTLLDQILQQDPHNGGALGLLGMHNFEHGNYTAAIQYWQPLLQSLDPADPAAAIFREGVARARELGGSDVAAANPSGVLDATGSSAVSSASASNSPGITLHISLGAGIQAAPSTVVFVFAKVPGGPPMPVAAIRLTVADLPATVVLDDSRVIQAGRHLVDFPQLEIAARLSNSGTPMAQAGDIQSAAQQITAAELATAPSREFVINTPVK